MEGSFASFSLDLYRLIVKRLNKISFSRHAYADDHTQAVWLFEELGLNYEIKSFRFDDVNEPPFIDINPNGRVPAIEDPNTGLTLWESGAIYQHLIEVYDTEKRLTYESLNERHLCNQWLHSVSYTHLTLPTILLV